MVVDGLSRRSFLKGAALTGAAAVATGALAGTSEAFADETDALGDDGSDEADSFTFADTVEWDAEYDVVVLGFGFAGEMAALGAAEQGASVLVCEKAPDGEAGGNSRVCAQRFVYTEGDSDGALQYFEALCGGLDYSEENLQVLADGVATLADTLQNDYGITGELYKRDAVSPEYPEFPGCDNIGSWGITDTDEGLTLYQRLRNLIESDYAGQIDVWFETPGVSLIQDPDSKTIVGVTVERSGESRNVHAINGVCMCTGGFEADRKTVKNSLGLSNYVIAGSTYNEGDGIKMCEAAGARLWHMNFYAGVGCTYYYKEDDLSYTALPTDIDTGSSIIVGSWGRRFFNETEDSRHGGLDNGNGVWEIPSWPESIYVVFDQTKMNEIEEAGGLDSDYADSVVSCASIAEAAEAIGCEESYLQETIDEFNSFVEAGEDYAFGRDVSTMRAFDGEAYYVVRCIGGIMSTFGGPEHNSNAETLDQDGEAIPHLYSAGELGNSIACMYQGGAGVAEALIFGHVAGVSAAAEKDSLPSYEARVAVESSPAYVGEESDLGVETDYAADAAEDELVGTGTGIGGEFAVYVTVDEDGVITSVEVGENSETEGIGSVAIEELPEQFIGLSTAEEIDAVDGTSGATVTSNAIKEAIKDALGLE